MPEATTLTRDESIEHFVGASALDNVLHNLRSSVATGEPGPLKELFTYDELTAISPWTAFDELWPEEDDRESAEFLLTQVRDEILTMRIFGALAERPEYLRELAAHFAGLAERDAAKLATLGAEGSATT